MRIKKGILYVFSANLLSLIISLFIGFVLPKLLSIETYANIKLFQLYITYIGIVSLGFADGMYLRIGGKDIKVLEKKTILEEFKTFKYFQFFVSIVGIIVSLILKNEMMLLCSIVILPVNIGGYLRNFYQATGKFDIYAKFININNILIFMINIFLVLIIKSNNYHIYISGYIVAYFLYWIYIENETRKIIGKEKNKANKKYLFEDIKSGFSLMIGNFCNVIFTSIDRLFVQNIMGTVNFAFFSFAVSIESLMNTFVTPISSVMYNYLCNNKEMEKIVRIKRIILIFSSSIIVLVFPAKFVINMWLDKYSGSLGVLFLLFSSQYISIMIRCIHINLYKAKKQQNKYFLTMIFIVVLSIILNIIFYYLLRTIEAFAIATLLTNIIWFIIGEINFKEYKLKIKDYIYTFIVIIIFLCCCEIDNAVIGCIIYVMILSIISIILMNKTIKYCLCEIRLTIENKLKNNNKLDIKQ